MSQKNVKTTFDVNIIGFNKKYTWRFLISFYHCKISKKYVNFINYIPERIRFFFNVQSLFNFFSNSIHYR